MRDVVALDGISVWLSGREILHDVSFSIRPGQFTGLIGSNGAGKTTILRVILGLQEPTAGRVLIDGKPRTRRNRSIGYVPQKVLIDPDLPVRARDVVGLGLDGYRFGLPMPSAVRRQRIDEMLEAVDAMGFADSRMGNLSGGEQQRVLIAHALIGRPELLLLDEPLANLDIASGHEIVELLRAHRGRAPSRRTALRPRHEPAAAGHGPGGLRGRRPGRQRHGGRGRAQRGTGRAVRPSGHRPAGRGSDPGGGRIPR